MSTCVCIRGLEFTYESQRDVHFKLPKCAEEGMGRQRAIIVETLTISRGELVIFCGANGAGKSTLLSILGGRKMVQKGVVNIFGRNCFDDCQLSSVVCYVGERWSDRFLDLTIAQFLGEEVLSKDRCKALCDILSIDLNWRISRLSEGQRRRCQIVSTFTSSEDLSVYILDETTADLDIVSRERLLSWLKTQARDSGATILYATHIFDGLNEWGSRLIFLENGIISHDITVDQSTNLYALVKQWMMVSQPTLAHESQ